MSFDTDFAEQLTARFREGNPDDKYKRKPVVSRRELVAALYEDIMAKRSAGYSVEGIAAYFGTLGAPIKVSTLKSYLMRCGHRRRSGLKVGAPPPPKHTRSRTPARARTERRGDRQGGTATDRSEHEGHTTSTSVVDSAEGGTAKGDENVAADASADAIAESVSTAPAAPPRTAGDVVGTNSEADAVESAPNPVEVVVSKAEVAHRTAEATEDAPAVAPRVERDKPAGDAVPVRRHAHTGIAKVQAGGFGNIGFVPRR